MENIRDINNELNMLFMDSYPANAVSKLEQMRPEEIAEVLGNIPMAITLKIWRRFSPQFGAGILKEMDMDCRVRMISQIEPNVGAGFLKALDETSRLAILDAIPERYIRNDLIRAMSYEEDTAGALMESRIIYFRPDMTVAEVISILRSQPRGMYRKLYTVDEEGQLSGSIDMEDLALAQHQDTLSTIERLNPVYVASSTNREDLLLIFDSQKITDLPVVDLDKHPIGVLRDHVLVGAALEESSVDMQTMVGVSKDERALSPATFATRKRLPWLYVNIVTTFLTASVVGLFEDNIARVTALAMLMPVVAGQSGNAGMQALVVTLRGLVLREVYPRMWARIIFKECKVGMMNGIGIAVTAGTGVYIWSNSVELAIVLGISMVMALTIASIAGAVIPLALTFAGRDPALSSSIFLTAISDMFGFFSFLGIAGLFIHIL